jgi:hypothetical protein
MKPISDAAIEAPAIAGDQLVLPTSPTAGRFSGSHECRVKGCPYCVEAEVVEDKAPVPVQRGAVLMLTAFCKEKRNLLVNTWCIGFTMRQIRAILRASTVGLATRCLWPLTNGQIR